MVRDTDKGEMRKTKTDLQGVWRNVSPYLGIGWFFVIAILLGLLFGKWLDGRLHSEPWFMLLGMIAGIFLGFYNLFRLVIYDGKKKDS